MGGGRPFPSPSGDNGDRGPGLSKARVSGNVSVLRAPGTDRHRAPLRGGPGGCCGRRGEEARLERMGCPVPFPRLWAAALSPLSEGPLKDLDLAGGLGQGGGGPRQGGGLPVRCRRARAGLRGEMWLGLQGLGGPPKAWGRGQSSSASLLGNRPPALTHLPGTHPRLSPGPRPLRGPAQARWPSCSAGLWPVRQEAQGGQVAVCAGAAESWRPAQGRRGSWGPSTEGGSGSPWVTSCRPGVGSPAGGRAGAHPCGSR